MLELDHIRTRLLKPVLHIPHACFFVFATSLLITGYVRFLRLRVELFIFPIELYGLGISVDWLRVHTFVDGRLSERTISNALVIWPFLHDLISCNRFLALSICFALDYS